MNHPSYTMAEQANLMNVVTLDYETIATFHSKNSKRETGKRFLDLIQGRYSYFDLMVDHERQTVFAVRFYWHSGDMYGVGCGRKITEVLIAKAWPRLVIPDGYTII